MAEAGEGGGGGGGGLGVSVVAALLRVQLASLGHGQDRLSLDAQNVCRTQLLAHERPAPTAEFSTAQVSGITQ